MVYAFFDKKSSGRNTPAGTTTHADKPAIKMNLSQTYK